MRLMGILLMVLIPTLAIGQTIPPSVNGRVICSPAMFPEKCMALQDKLDDETQNRIDNAETFFCPLKGCNDMRTPRVLHPDEEQRIERLHACAVQMKYAMKGMDEFVQATKEYQAKKDRQYKAIAEWDRVMKECVQ